MKKLPITLLIIAAAVYVLQNSFTEESDFSKEVKLGKCLCEDEGGYYDTYHNQDGELMYLCRNGWSINANNKHVNEWCHNED